MEPFIEVVSYTEVGNAAFLAFMSACGRPGIDPEKHRLASLAIFEQQINDDYDMPLMWMIEGADSVDGSPQVFDITTDMLNTEAHTLPVDLDGFDEV